MAEKSDDIRRAQLWVERVDIRNFRGLTTQLDLERGLTLLVGRNNSGKSRVLRAIALALGDVPAELDDVTVGSGRPATVDVVVAPRVKADESEEFEDEIAQIVRPEVTSQEPFRERFAWRATVRTSEEGEGARADFARLTWNDSGWELQETAPAVSRRRELRFLSGSVIDTRRDLAEEQSRRGTAIRRLLSSLDIEHPLAGELTEELRRLGGRIVEGSAALQAILAALEEADGRVGGFGRAGLNALPADVEELARAVSFELDSGSGALPMRLHGSGPRSLASLLVQGVYYDRRLGRDRPELLPHPVSLIEEPEAHLHPQMQAELPHLLANRLGQVVASTHSAVVASEVDHDAIRVLRPGADQLVEIVDLKAVEDPDPAEGHDDEAVPTQPPRLRRPALHASEIEKLKRLVERPFGEVLFSSALVIGDGATERAFLPAVLRHALGSNGHGVVVVDPGSMSNAMPLAKLADAIDLPWYLFVDRDGEGTADAARICQQFGSKDSAGKDRCVFVLDSKGATETMLLAHDRDMCLRAVTTVRPDLVEDPANLDLARLMHSQKGFVGRAYAHELIEAYDDWTLWPESLRTLVETLNVALQPADE